MTNDGMIPEAVLFDVDGTLIDSYHLYLESYRRALQPFLGYVPGVEEFVRRTPSSERHFLVDWIGEENAAACREAMNRHYQELHGTLCEGMYEGVREMLNSLRAAGIPLGIVTGKGRHAWEVTAAALELGEFGVVITDDDVERPKPDPGGLLSGAAALGAEPAATVYVGDSIADVRAARLAGMRAGAALWPKTAPDDRERFLVQVREHEPAWLFERPADVTRVFARWC